jgi:hypothetical protein
VTLLLVVNVPTDVKFKAVKTFKAAELPIVIFDDVLVVRVPIFKVPLMVLFPVPEISIDASEALIVPELDKVELLKVNVLPVPMIRVAPEGITKVALVIVQLLLPVEKEVDPDELDRLKVLFELKFEGLEPVPFELEVQLLSVDKALVAFDLM